MALPIEATPVLDEENWIHLLNRMKHWEENPKPAPVPEIDSAALDRADEAWLARRNARLVKENKEQNEHDA